MGIEHRGKDSWQEAADSQKTEVGGQMAEDGGQTTDCESRIGRISAISLALTISTNCTIWTTL